MPNRILKDSICSSENLDALTNFQEVVFYRLIVNCDDYGRMDARPKLLASVLFPLRDVRANQIEDALRALESAELVAIYKVNGKPFLQMKTWNRHQRVRDSKEKYPGPEESDADDSPQVAANRGELPRVAARVRGCAEAESNPIQSESNPNIDDGEYTRTCARDGMDRMTENMNKPQSAYDYLVQIGIDMSDPYIIEEYRDTMEMGFSDELVIYAASRAKSSGKVSWAYIRSVLINWHENGIKTVEQAKEDLKKHRANNRRNHQGNSNGSRTEYDLKPNFV